MNLDKLKSKIYMDRFLRANRLPVSHFIRQWLTNGTDYNIIGYIGLEWRLDTSCVNDKYFSRGNTVFKPNSFYIEVCNDDRVSLYYQKSFDNLQKIDRTSIYMDSIEEAKHYADCLIKEYICNFVEI